MTSPRGGSRVRSIEAAAAAGVAFAVLDIIALILLSSTPDPSASDSQMTAWYSDPANRTLLTIGLLLSVVSAVLFLWFVAVIRRRVGDREDRFFATVFFGSGILLTGVMLVGAAAVASPAVTVDLAGGRVPDAGVLTAMSGLGTTLLLVVLLRIQAVFVVSTSTLALRSNAFSRWLSYFGYGIAFAMFFAPILTRPLGLAFPVWVGVLSAALFVRRSNIIPDSEPG